MNESPTYWEFHQGFLAISVPATHEWVTQGKIDGASTETEAFRHTETEKDTEDCDQ